MRSPLAMALAVAVVALLLLALSWQDGALRLLRVSPSPGGAPMPAETPTRIRPDPHAPEGTGDVAPPVVVPSPVAPPRGDAPSPAPTGTLLLPVAGVQAAQLHDTFTDARSAGRSHDAIDIMAPAGTPVLAVADGHVEKLFDSARGGLTIYQFEPGGKLAYYYAHLQRYADGLAEGQAVKRGQVIGYVGSTGNASPDAPHLHFAILVLGPEKRWWEGTAINPYPLLGGTARREAASRP